VFFLLRLLIVNAFAGRFTLFFRVKLGLAGVKLGLAGVGVFGFEVCWGVGVFSVSTGVFFAVGVFAGVFFAVDDGVFAADDGVFFAADDGVFGGLLGSLRVFSRK